MGALPALRWSPDVFAPAFFQPTDAALQPEAHQQLQCDANRFNSVKTAVCPLHAGQIDLMGQNWRLTPQTLRSDLLLTCLATFDRPLTSRIWSCQF